MYRPVVPALAAVVALAACSGTGDSERAVVRRDSAGIQIVETVRIDSAADARWTVAAAPALSIGLVEGDPKYLFGVVTGAVRLDDGAIVVADGQAGIIHFYDAAGRHARTVGGDGGGPGEFANLLGISQCGAGRLYADERMRDEIVVWDEDGELVRIFDLLEPGREPPRGVNRWACGPAGDIIAAGAGDTRATMSALTESQFFEQTGHVWVLDSLGQAVLDLGEQLVSERLFVYNRHTRVRGSWPHPFGREISFALGSDRIYIGSGERLEVDVLDRSGRPRRIVRGPVVDRALSPDMLERYRASELSNLQRVVADGLAESGIALPDSVPAYTDMRLDPLDHLWVRRFQRPDERGERWGVFGPDGTFLGHVAMPPGLDVQQIGDDFVLGVTRDELGVARVVVHTLRRRPPQR